MSIVLWILQVLVALVFFAHGYIFVAPPTPEMADQMNAVYPVALRIFIGVAEILAAIGMLLPGITRIMPILTVFAGLGLMIVMTCAAIFHLVRAEFPMALSCLVILAIVTFVTYGRWKLRPFVPRNNAPVVRAS